MLYIPGKNEVHFPFWKYQSSFPKTVGDGEEVDLVHKPTANVSLFIIPFDLIYMPQVTFTLMFLFRYLKPNQRYGRLVKAF